MKLKILFIKPPLRTFSSAVAPPMGLLYLSSYAKKYLGNILDIKLIDMRVSAINNLKKLSNYLKVFNPQIVGLSCCTEDDFYMHKIVKEVKLFNRKILTIVGGPHPTMYTQEVMEDENIDISVIGEAEITFYEILKSYLEQKDFTLLKGIAVRKNGSLIVNPRSEFIQNLDILPFPDWDLLEIDKYSLVKYNSMNTILVGKKYMGIVTSRGCPFRCIYCHEIFGKKFRKRSAENVIKEIKILKEKYKIDEIHIYDDIFNLDKKRVYEICDLLINSGVKIKFCFPNGLRADILDKELILRLKQSGAYMLTFALETASPRLQKMIKKNINIPKFQKNVIFADKIGLLTKCYFMLGFPTETIQEINYTINYACSLPLTFASFFIVTVQKSTQLYNLVTNLYPNFKIKFNENQYYLPHKSYEQILSLPLKKLQIKAYRKFYFSFKRIIKILIRIPRKIFLIVNIHKYLFSYFFNIWPKLKKY